ncbi:uncharacterized protein LOC110978609 [Acanthaster planci]|uniref:Uncharacterized protein LOC110978609 n=1 Tax=Acanthaster planci TaxID=133434 RepID=A0A8B7YAL8_ACAPL|nr:uncharacterized protein LOC110978609 [Acanthaster planci]XP_022089426.1 uncharacterized protein LOC110978609 [Acanthaster planci]
MDNKKHSVLFICLVILVLAEFIMTLFVNALAGIGSSGTSIDWFLNSTGEISDYYYVEITPAGWTFTIWAFIYTYQALIVLYWLTSICRRNKTGYVYRSPAVITPVMLVLYAINLVLNMTWLFLFDRQYLPAAVVVSAFLPTTLCIILFMNHRLVDQHGYDLVHNKRGDLVAIRAIIQNGMAFYATWVTIATLLNLSIVLSYWGGMEQSTACTISLSILLVEVLLYSVLENVVWERYLRYTYTVWLVVIFALIGSIAKNWNVEKTNSIFSVVLCGLAFALFLIKLVVSVWRTFTYPLYAESTSLSKEELALA